MSETTDPAAGTTSPVAVGSGSGEPEVLAVLARAGDLLGLTLDDLLGVLNPHAVILGGCAELTAGASVLRTAISGTPCQEAPGCAAGAR